MWHTQITPDAHRSLRLKSLTDLENRFQLKAGFKADFCKTPAIEYSK